MKILLVQTSFLGDVVLSTPVIAGIKKLYPESALWMLTTPLAKDLVCRDPLLSGVIVFDKRKTAAGISGLWRLAQTLKREGFDRVYALQRSCRTSLLLWLARIPERIGFSVSCLSFLYSSLASRLVGRHEVLRNLSLLVPEQSLESFCDELRLFAPEIGQLSAPVRAFLEGTGDFVVIVPGSSWHTKMWHAAGYRKVAAHLLQRGFRVVLIGAPSEEKAAQDVSEGQNVLNLVGKSSVAESMTIVKNAKLVVCNDSMALHMASAFKVPAVAVFCATSPDFGFGPWQNRALVVEKKGLECKPCRRHGGNTCPNGTEACMKDLSYTEVLLAIEKLI
jgi:heptosyltransferase II